MLHREEPVEELFAASLVPYNAQVLLFLPSACNPRAADALIEIKLRVEVA